MAEEIQKTYLIKKTLGDLARAQPVTYVSDVIAKMKGEGVSINEGWVRETIRGMIGNRGEYSIKKQPDGKIVILNNNFDITYLDGYNFNESWLRRRAEEMKEGVTRKLSTDEIKIALYDKFQPQATEAALSYFQNKGLNVVYDPLEDALKLKSTGFEAVHERAKNSLYNRYRHMLDRQDELKEKGGKIEEVVKKEKNKEELSEMERQIQFLQYAISAEREEPVSTLWRVKKPLVQKVFSKKENEHLVGQIYFWLSKEGGKFTPELEDITGRSWLEVRHDLEILASLPEEKRTIKVCPYIMLEPKYECISFKEPLVEAVETSQIERLSEFGEEFKDLSLETLRKSGEVSIEKGEFTLILANKEEMTVRPVEKTISYGNESIGVESAFKIINDAWNNYRKTVLL